MDSLTEFLSSWTFMLLMLGLLCFLLLLLPIGFILPIVFVRRANREDRDVRD